MADIKLPTIFFWLEYTLDKPALMTAAFQHNGQLYGRSFPYDEEHATIHKQMLVNNVRDTLDTLIHHGVRVLDSTGNINPRLAHDEEAERFYKDPLWRERIQAFHKALLIKDITRDQAVKLGLLDK